jgi:hypothetical protein
VKGEECKRNLERYRKEKDRKEKEGNTEHKDAMKNKGNKRKNVKKVDREGLGKQRKRGSSVKN